MSEEGLSIEFTQDEVKADGLVDNQKNAAHSAWIWFYQLFLAIISELTELIFQKNKIEY